MFHAGVIGHMPKSKHRRHGKRRLSMTRPAPVIWGSARAHEILGAAETLIEERLRKIVGTSRPWTPDDYDRATRQLHEEGLLDTATIVPKLLRELTVVR